ncbi:MAG: NADP-dependent phosphogluconate dehydrogenase [Pseudomonadota bacterium]
MVGLGVMGANLALNLAEKGFRVAIYDRDAAKRSALSSGDLGWQFVDCGSEADLFGAIRAPRPVILLVPAGAATDTALTVCAGVASAGDLLIDAGNSDFHDTRRRTIELEARGLRFLGIGVSGGAEGARHGPAMMAGGSRTTWDRVAPMFHAIAAHYEQSPCAAWLGPDGAGHFVKTVHNGIEYAEMQMIAEIYGVMRDGLDLSEAEIADTFRRWAGGPLASYLIEITGAVAGAVDDLTGQPLLQVIADRAGQKGTGRWSVIEAQKLGAVASTIEAAVAARNLSAATDLRGLVSPRSTRKAALELTTLHDAMLVGKIIAYAQGFDLLMRASVEYDWDLRLADIARVWRAGCIIRSDMLDDMAAAFDAKPDASLLTTPVFQDRLAAVSALRQTVADATLAALPTPALGNALSYIDQVSARRGTANMLQGLRDCFGQHGFERTDRPGTGFHGPWVAGG